MDRLLDPSIRVVWLVSGLIWAVVPLVALVIGWAFGVPGWLLGILGAVAAVVGVIAITYPLARYRNWGYRLGDDDLVIRHGVVFKLERWIPRTRVQYVDIAGGPIERALGIRTLVVYTAGSGLLSVSVPGLPLAEAESLRAELLAWSVGGTEDEPVAAPPDPAPPVGDDAGDPW